MHDFIIGRSPVGAAAGGRQRQVKAFAAQNGVDGSMTGAAGADPQKQVDISRMLIAEKPNAITVAPNSPEALEGVLKQARAAGIKVVTHEAGTAEHRCRHRGIRQRRLRLVSDGSAK
jgi:ABC-type sugar transport system substrate-binding protein